MQTIQLGARDGDRSWRHAFGQRVSANSLSDRTHLTIREAIREKNTDRTVGEYTQDRQRKMQIVTRGKKDDWCDKKVSLRNEKKLAVPRNKKYRPRLALAPRPKNLDALERIRILRIMRYFVKFDKWLGCASKFWNTQPCEGFDGKTNMIAVQPSQGFFTTQKLDAHPNGFKPIDARCFLA
ncbi:MAG: hypothetical protein HY868_04425 [Chloroflexi bacterium]|nr:hypothetical protein [Chloroflexota bacterium]